jgi:hypothetical protein
MYGDLLCEWGDKSEQRFSTPYFLPQAIKEVLLWCLHFLIRGEYIPVVYLIITLNPWGIDAPSFHPNHSEYVLLMISSFITRKIFFCCLWATCDLCLCYTPAFHWYHGKRTCFGNFLLSVIRLPALPRFPGWGRKIWNFFPTHSRRAGLRCFKPLLCSP